MDTGSQQEATKLGSQPELYSKGAIKKREPANREPRIQQRDGKLSQGAHKRQRVSKTQGATKEPVMSQQAHYIVREPARHREPARLRELVRGQ